MRGKDFIPHIWTGRSDLDALLHPAQAYDHPDDVANDPDLSLNEKRAILASWASDACAVEAAPALRCAPGGKWVVSFDEVMDALRGLDREAQEQQGGCRSPSTPALANSLPQPADRRFRERPARIRALTAANGASLERLIPCCGSPQQGR